MAQETQVSKPNSLIRPLGPKRTYSRSEVTSFQQHLQQLLVAIQLYTGSLQAAFLHQKGIGRPSRGLQEVQMLKNRMNGSMNRWGKGMAAGYTVLLVTHFMKGKGKLLKIFHAVAYTYMFHHLYTLSKSLGVLFNLRCDFT